MSPTQTNPNIDYNAGLAAPASTGAGTYNPALANPTYTPGSNFSTQPQYTPPASISSAQLAPTSAPNFQSPTQTPTYPVAGLAASVASPALSQPEQKAQDTSTQLQSLNDQLIGKSAYTQDLYKQQGFGTTVDANGNMVGDPGTADLTAKLTGLTNEALAIPLQIQNNAIGRDVTQGELQPVTTAHLRDNSIKALGVSSLIAAKNGQLETAKHYVDNALQQKYGPIEEQQKAKAANLALIMNSPSYDAATKKRAADAAALVAKQTADLAQQKTNDTNTQNDLVKIISNNPTITSTQMAELQKAKDPVALAQAAAAYHLMGSDATLPASAQEFNFAKQNGYTGSYTQYQNEDANRKAAIAKAGVGSQGSGGLLDAVLANPELFNQLTPTSKASLAPALAAAGFNAFGKPLDPTAITHINQTDYALTSLSDLRAKLVDNQDMLGPISGLAALNPYSKARTVQADIDRVRQTVGKALEGGVLRKEDEEKYKKILATLTDTPATALYKIDALVSSLQGNLADYKALQASAGKSDLSTPSSQPTNLRAKYNY